MARIKTKGQSAKDQGSPANTDEASSTNVMPEPRTYKRGIGSAYAYAVETLIKNADKISGSKNGFLGVNKKELDPNEYGQHSLLPKDFEPRKKR
jgi:hypothetical protein